MEIESHFAVELEGVSASRGSQSVLRSVSCGIRAGEVVAVTGPSGAGKSTLLGILCGTLSPETGSIRILGQERSKDSDAAWSKLRLECFGLVFQADELLPELTILENLTLPLRLGAKPMRTDHYRSLALQFLERLGIAELADRRVYEVSGGQLQRAAVARAVIHRPRLILADEPTENLDQVAASAALRLLIELAREQHSTVIIVTHDAGVVGACDREIRLVDGVLAQGAVEVAARA